MNGWIAALIIIACMALVFCILTIYFSLASPSNPKETHLFAVSHAGFYVEVDQIDYGFGHYGKSFRVTIDEGGKTKTQECMTEDGILAMVVLYTNNAIVAGKVQQAFGNWEVSNG